MKKFIVQHLKGKCSIYEIECEKVLWFNPNPAWQRYFEILSPDLVGKSVPQLEEYRVKVIKPESLYESKVNGTIEAPIYHNHSLYESLEDAKIEAEKDIRGSFERQYMKSEIKYTEEDIIKSLSNVKVIML